MAKKKKEAPVADESTGKIKVKAKTEKQSDGNETKGNVTKIKEKMKMKPIVQEQSITKVDLSKPPKTETDAVQEPETNASDAIIGESENSGSGEKVVEEIRDTKEESGESKDTVQNEKTPVLEEVTQEVKEEVEEIAEEVSGAIKENLETGEPLPENIQKLINFMEETGGDLTDYVTLNQDYSELDNHTLLKEYYKSTKPHLSDEEVDFVMEDTFSYDEDADEERDIKRKKLAMKEQVAQARQHLDSVKSKYYEDIKSGSKLTNEQQEAIEFFNKHNEESDKNYEKGKMQHDIFANKTNKVFHDKFKGFEYNIGEKRFRFNVKDPVKLKETQGDINNFIKKFLTKDNTMDDATGYHKGLFTAMNPDQVANHFYEQGKADALKESIAKSKNVNMDPRQGHTENVNTSGFTVRALDNDQSDFKFKIKNKNK